MEIALLGFGTVGKALFDHIETLQKQGSSLFHVKKILVKEGEVDTNPLFTTSIDTILTDPNIEIVVEMMGGFEPAFTYLSDVIKAKKHVITSNKNLVSEYGDKLSNLAVENKVGFLCSASVGGGIPILAELRDLSKQEEILDVTGIFNGTTNYILDAMTRLDLTFEEALKQAQQAGYAEAIPTNDVQGVDLLYKARVLANVTWKKWISPASIDRLTMHTVTSEDIEYFKRHNQTLRYLTTILKNDDGKLSVFIQPTALQSLHPFALIQKNLNVFRFQASRSQTQSRVGPGAGGAPTAANIYRDLQRIERGDFEMIPFDATLSDADNLKAKFAYYIRASRSALEILPSETIETSDANDVVITHPLSVTKAHTYLRSVIAIDPKLFACAILDESGYQ